MRYLVLIVALFVGWNTWSEGIKEKIPPIAGKAEGADKTKSDPNNQQTVTIEFPATVNINVSGKLETKSEDTKRKAEEEPSKWTDPLSLFTGLLVVVTAGLIAMGWYQVRTIRSIERAFVYFKTVDITSVRFPDGNRLIRHRDFVPIFENGGSTAAKRAITHVSMIERADDLPATFDFPDTWLEGGDKKYYPTYIAPKAEARCHGFEVDTFVIDEIKSKTKRVFVYGWIEYDDIFENSPRHRTEFCHEVLIGSGNTESDSLPIIFAPTGKFNGTDEDCYRKPKPATEYVNV